MDILSGKGVKHKENELSTDELVEKWKNHLEQKHNLDGIEIRNEERIPLPNQTESSAEDRNKNAELSKKMTPSMLLLEGMANMRVGAPFWRQAYLCHQRSLIQQYRQVKSFMLEISVSALAGGLMGLSVMVRN